MRRVSKEIIMKKVVMDITIIVWIVTIFALLMAGSFEISFNPWYIRFNKPLQLIGIILISAGICMIYHQGKIDSISENEKPGISIKD